MNETKSKVTPTDGEAAAAKVFCFFYLIIMGLVAGLVAYFVIGLIFKDTPQGYGFLLALLVFGMLPHATKVVAESLAQTRNMPFIKRLGKLLAAIHS